MKIKTNKDRNYTQKTAKGKMLKMFKIGVLHVCNV